MVRKRFRGIRNSEDESSGLASLCFLGCIWEDSPAGMSNEKRGIIVCLGKRILKRGQTWHYIFCYTDG